MNEGSQLEWSESVWVRARITGDEFCPNLARNVVVWTLGWGGFGVVCVALSSLAQKATRLRSILSKRHGGTGKGRGDAQVKWPDRFFAELGLFSLERAHVLACQSMKMGH